MAQARRPPASNRIPQFTTETRLKIRSILGDTAAASVLTHFEALVAEYRDLTPTELTRRTASTDREIKKLVAALRSVVRCVDRSSDTLRGELDTNGTLGDIAFGRSRWKHLTEIRELAAVSVKRLQVKRGRPRMDSRETLSLQLAIVSYLSGIGVSKSRTGQFTRVLQVILADVLGEHIADVRPITSVCANFLKGWKDEDLRGLLDDSRRLGISPASAVWAREWPPRRN